MKDQRRTCPECNGNLRQIRLIDKTHYNVHAELEYTDPDAKKGFWMNQYPVEGKVYAYMCESCGRILLYGLPGME